MQNQINSAERENLFGFDILPSSSISTSEKIKTQHVELCKVLGYKSSFPYDNILFSINSRDLLIIS